MTNIYPRISGLTRSRSPRDDRRPQTNLCDCGTAHDRQAFCAAMTIVKRQCRCPLSVTAPAVERTLPALKNLFCILLLVLQCVAALSLGLSAWDVESNSTAHHQQVAEVVERFEHGEIALKSPRRAVGRGFSTHRRRQHLRDSWTAPLRHQFLAVVEIKRPLLLPCRLVLVPSRLSWRLSFMSKLGSSLGFLPRKWKRQVRIEYNIILYLCHYFCKQWRALGIIANISSTSLFAAAAASRFPIFCFFRAPPPADAGAPAWDFINLNFFKDEDKVQILYSVSRSLAGWCHACKRVSV